MELSSLDIAAAARISVLEMTARAQAAHTGSSLSVVDILSVVFAYFVRPRDTERGKSHCFISKGHASAATYATMAHAGYFSPGLLGDFCVDGSDLGGHVTKSRITGVELSTGSLGHALPYAVGVALSARMDQIENRSVVILSDGELDEGSNWEAALFAGHLELSNLIVVVDRNGLQSLGATEDTIRLEPLRDKWEAFGWNVLEVDGHDHKQLKEALKEAERSSAKPTVVICRTVKGKGVSFMENQVLWHYRPPSETELAAAIREVSGRKL